MACYRHWQNRPQGGETAFLTTTCLDFNHAFTRSEIKDAVVALLAGDHIFYQARLFAYVVMSNHIHLLTGLPADKNGSWFCQRLKSNLAKALLPRLTDAELAGFDIQRGLDKRQFWQRSYRGMTVNSEHMFDQKLDYIHLNPVRARLVSEPSEYRWSTFKFLHNLGTEEEYSRGIAELVLNRFGHVLD